MSKTSQQMLMEMNVPDRTALTTMLETAYSNIRGVEAMLYQNEGPCGAEHGELRELLGAANERVESVLDRVRAADAHVVMNAPSLRKIDA
jgi:hypothetical protein